MDIWDINLLLFHYEHSDHNGNLKYKDLVKKTIKLLVIIGDGRKQVLPQ